MIGGLFQVRDSSLFWLCNFKCFCSASDSPSSNVPLVNRVMSDVFQGRQQLCSHDLCFATIQLLHCRMSPSLEFELNFTTESCSHVCTHTCVPIFLWLHMERIDHFLVDPIPVTPEPLAINCCKFSHLSIAFVPVECPISELAEPLTLLPHQAI